jgi:hypothetical protein
MRRTFRGINLELACAVRRINALLDRIPDDEQPDLSGESWHSLERELERACGVGDHEAALRAICIGRRH